MSYQPSRDGAPTELEQKLEERDRLLRSYRRRRRAEAERIAEEMGADRAAEVKRAIGMLRPDSSAGFFASLRAADWLRDGPRKWRLHVLTRADKRIDRILRARLKATLDDPLPPSMGGYDSAFVKARELLR